MSRFSDIDLVFTTNPRTGRVAYLDAKSAIYQALNNILMVRNGEKLYNEDFGVGLQEQLFELNDFITRDSLKTDIINQIQNYESRITVNDVRLTEDLNYLTIYIDFYLNTNNQELISFEQTIKRIR